MRKFRFEANQEEVAKRTEEQKRETGMGSEDFWSCFCYGGGLVSTCLCGRTVFADKDDGDWEPGEIERLRELAKEKPDRYIGLSDDSTSVSSIGIVWGCSCKTGQRYENFIIEHRREILSYLRRWAKRRYDSAKTDIEDVLKTLKDYDV